MTRDNYLTAYELHLFQRDTIEDAGARLYIDPGPLATRHWTLEDDDETIRRVCPTEECSGDVR